MNLTVRSTLSSMIGQTATLSGMMKDRLEQTQELNEALEYLCAAREQSQALISMLTDIETAQGSLEACGFSDEWLESVSANGRFLKAVNLDLVKMVGTKEEKTAVAMEGFWSTVWDYIKKIFNFIVDVFNRIVNFIRRLLGILRSDEKIIEKGNKALDLLVSLGNENAHPEKLGEAMNNCRGSRSGKMYDMRELIQRMSAAKVMATYITNNVEDVFGIATTRDKDTGKGYYSPTFEEYVIGGDHSNKTTQRPNIMLKELLDTFETNPSKIGDVVHTFAGGFRVVNNNQGIKEALKSVGYSVGYMGQEVRIFIDPMEKAVSVIDYKSIYHSIEDYASVFGDYFNYMKFLNSNNVFGLIEREITRLKDFANDALKLFDKRNSGSYTGDRHAEFERITESKIFSAEGKWLLEIANILGQLISAFNSGNTQAQYLVNALSDIAPKIKEAADK